MSACAPLHYAKQDPVMYGAKFDVVFVANGLRTASIHDGLDCLELYRLGLDGECYFWLVVELT